MKAEALETMRTKKEFVQDARVLVTQKHYQDTIDDVLNAMQQDKFDCPTACGIVSNVERMVS